MDRPQQPGPFGFYGFAQFHLRDRQDKARKGHQCYQDRTRASGASPEWTLPAPACLPSPSHARASTPHPTLSLPPHPPRPGAQHHPQGCGAPTFRLAPSVTLTPCGGRETKLCHSELAPDPEPAPPLRQMAVGGRKSGSGVPAGGPPISGRVPQLEEKVGAQSRGLSPELEPTWAPACCTQLRAWARVREDGDCPHCL